MILTSQGITIVCLKIEMLVIAVRSAGLFVLMCVLKYTNKLKLSPQGAIFKKINLRCTRNSLRLFLLIALYDSFSFLLIFSRLFWYECVSDLTGGIG